MTNEKLIAFSKLLFEHGAFPSLAASIKQVEKDYSNGYPSDALIEDAIKHTDRLVICDWDKETGNYHVAWIEGEG